MSAKNLIELENGAYKVKLKLCQVQIFVEDALVEPLSQTSDNSIFDSGTLIIPKSQENQDIQTTSLLQSDNKETPKRPSKNTDDVSSHNSIPFQKKMESFKLFTRAVERKFEKLILDLPTKDKQSNLVIELLKIRISALEKQLIEKDAIINFQLRKVLHLIHQKENSETSN